MLINTNDIPLTLYIHLPWCVRKCPYCDFNSHQINKQDFPEKDYIETLLKDLQLDLPKISQRQLSAIFIGGGTPSLFSGDSIDALLTGIHRYLPFDKNIEITLEANPGTVEQQRFKQYYQAGINRISLGIQSFNDAKLKTLGRIHSATEAEQAIDAVKKAGFTNFNLDLMFGLPDQTLLEGMQDLQLAMKHKPTHLSWYKLTLEPNTHFYQYPPTLPEDDLIWQLFDEGQRYLSQSGYKHYEISAYSQEGYQCHHNRNYWEFGDYLGIGAGAHSKITLANQEIVRFWKIKHPKLYLQANRFIYEEKNLTAEQLPFEFMLNHLRLNEEVSIQLFEQRTGLAITTIETVLEEAQQKGFLLCHKDSIALTELGKQFTNDVLELFL